MANNDGTGGRCTCPFHSTLDLPAEFTLEGPNNDIPSGATLLPLVEDPVASGCFAGFGLVRLITAVYQDWWSETDYWRFEAVAGDRVSASVDTPGSDLNSAVWFVRCSGNMVASDYYDSGPDSDAYISHYVIPGSGTYYVRWGASRLFGTPGTISCVWTWARGFIGKRW